VSGSSGGASGVVARLVRTQFFWGALVIVLLLALDLIRDPSYLSITYSPDAGGLVGNVIDIVKLSAPILMISLGMVFVIATAGIDLSVGSVMAVAGAIALQSLYDAPDPNSFAAIASSVGMGLAAGLVVGLINAVLVSVVGLQPFVSTLVMMMAGRGLAKVITGGQNTSVQASTGYHWIANGYVLGLPVVFLIALAIIVVVAVVVRRTALGMMIESIGINPRASRMAGIQPRGLLITVYALSGLLAAVAGIMATSTVNTIDVAKTGYSMEMDAILAVVVGGTSLAGGKFSISGTFVGGLLIATLNKTVLFLGIPAEATPVFKATIIIAICLLQSSRIRALFQRRRSTPAALVRPAQKEAVSA
jgi:simple sugar transport system permease protein